MQHAETRGTKPKGEELTMTMGATSSRARLFAVAVLAAICACAVALFTAQQAFALDEGDTFKVGGNTYKVIDADDDSEGLDEVALVKYGSSDKTPSINTVKYDGEKYEVNTIGKNAFNNSKGHKITSIKLGTAVDEIGAKAFYGCKKLKVIDMRKCEAIDVEMKSGEYVIEDIDVGAKAFAKAGVKKVKVKCGSSNSEFRKLFKKALRQKGMRSTVKVVK